LMPQPPTPSIRLSGFDGLSQLRDTDPQRGMPGLRRFAPPQLRYQPVAGNHVVHVEQQDGQQRPLLGPGDRPFASVVPDFQGPQDAELHARPSVPASYHERGTLTWANPPPGASRDHARGAGRPVSPVLVVSTSKMRGGVSGHAGTPASGGPVMAGSVPTSHSGDGSRRKRVPLRRRYAGVRRAPHACRGQHDGSRHSGAGFRRATASAAQTIAPSTTPSPGSVAEQI